MLQLSFGEQVKIVLSRRGITIKQLAEMIEDRTKKKMSRQNLTQRLSRDNFQEKDMRLIADVLGCSLEISLVDSRNGEEEKSLSPDAERANMEIKRRKAVAKQEERVHAGNKDRAITWYKREAEAAVSKSGGSRESSSRAIEQAAIAREHANRIAVSEEERDITIGELVDIHQELDELEGKNADISNEELLAMLNQEIEELRKEDAPTPRQAQLGVQETLKESIKKVAIGNVFKRYLNRKSLEIDQEPIQIAPEAIDEEDPEEKVNQAILEEAARRREQQKKQKAEGKKEEPVDPSTLAEGSFNPYTNQEYETNSVRVHPNRIGYVQVYDRTDHKWTDMTEWAFLGYQERKKSLLGKEYDPPIYLD